MFPRFLALALLLGALALPAAAQTVSAQDPDGITRTLRDFGYRATLTTANDGDPKIQSAIEGVNYTIFFYGCDQANRDCRDIQFSAGFDLTKATSPFQMNEWNRDWILGKAFADDQGDAFLQMFVPGVTDIPRESFRRIVFRWGQGLADFQDHIGW